MTLETLNRATEIKNRIKLLTNYAEALTKQLYREHSRTQTLHMDVHENKTFTLDADLIDKIRNVVIAEMDAEVLKLDAL